MFEREFKKEKQIENLKKMVGKGKKLKKHKRDEESIIKNKIKEAEDKFWE